MNQVTYPRIIGTDGATVTALDGDISDAMQVSDVYVTSDPESIYPSLLLMNGSTITPAGYGNSV